MCRVPHTFAFFANVWALRSDGTLADHDNSSMITRYVPIDSCEHELATSRWCRHPLIGKERELVGHPATYKSVGCAAGPFSKSARRGAPPFPSPPTPLRT